MLKVNNKDTRTIPMASLCVLINNCEHISHLALVFVLLNCMLNKIACEKSLPKKDALVFIMKFLN